MKISKIFDVFVVFSTENEFGKKGGCKGIFSSEATANEIYEDCGWWGGRGIKERRKATNIEEKCYLLEGPIDLDQKEHLAKLSVEERKALNLI